MVVKDALSASRTSLVTIDITAVNQWVLPLKNIQHFDYGSKGKLIVSTEDGLYEANCLRQTIANLKPQGTGRVTFFSNGAGCNATEENICPLFEVDRVP